MVCLEPKCINNSLICSHCLYQNHFGHKAIPVEEFRENKLKILSDNQSRGKKTGLILRDIKNGINERLEKDSNYINEKMEEIIDYVHDDLAPILMSFL